MQNRKLPYMVVRSVLKNGTFCMALKHKDIQQYLIDSSILFIAEEPDVLPLSHATDWDQDSSVNIYVPCTARRRTQPPDR